jgi:hypothetical protein
MVHGPGLTALPACPAQQVTISAGLLRGTARPGGCPGAAHRSACVVAQGYCEWRPRLLRMTQRRKVGSALEEFDVFATKV